LCTSTALQARREIPTERRCGVRGPERLGSRDRRRLARQNVEPTVRAFWRRDRNPSAGLEVLGNADSRALASAATGVVLYIPRTKSGTILGDLRVVRVRRAGQGPAVDLALVARGCIGGLERGCC
jgi:hypothetical protein